MYKDKIEAYLKLKEQIKELEKQYETVKLELEALVSTTGHETIEGFELTFKEVNGEAFRLSEALTVLKREALEPYITKFKRYTLTVKKAA